MLSLNAHSTNSAYNHPTKPAVMMFIVSLGLKVLLRLTFYNGVGDFYDAVDDGDDGDVDSEGLSDVGSLEVDFGGDDDEHDLDDPSDGASEDGEVSEIGSPTLSELRERFDGFLVETEGREEAVMMEDIIYDSCGSVTLTTGSVDDVDLCSEDGDEGDMMEGVLYRDDMEGLEYEFGEDADLMEGIVYDPPRYDAVSGSGNKWWQDRRSWI
ncbi:hypothetical protein HK098_001732 [Nowakowskiella sp. JEL0407]|nr:hypothetical protein HK098_001732 [Nowakowskiella sp. JEL0407]